MNINKIIKKREKELEEIDFHFLDECVFTSQPVSIIKDFEKIKQFNQQTIKEVLEEIRKEVILKEKVTLDTSCKSINETHGYNKALEDISSELKNIINNLK